MTRIIPTIEVRHTIWLGNGDSITAGALTMGDRGTDARLTNFVAATTFKLGQQSNLTAAHTRI